MYLDYNATTPLDPEVFAEMRPVFESHFGNPASTTHPFGWYAEELILLARERVAASINADKNDVVFTSGATESNNLAIFGVAEAHGSGHIISAETEHKAVLDPLDELEKRGFEISLLKVNSQGHIDLKDLENALRKTTILVSLMLANNEIGTIHQTESISKICADAGIVFHCDAVQALGKIDLDVDRLGADLISISGHKCYGPKGTGALYIRRKKPKLDLRPQLFGGGHEGGLRSGTLNVPGCVGLGKACQLAKIRREKDSEHLRTLGAKAWHTIQANFPKAKLNGCTEKRLPGNLNILLPGVSSARLIGKINTKVALSTSSACQSASLKPSHVLSAIGLNREEQESSIRMGLGRMTSSEELEYALEVILETANLIRTRAS